ncbi:MAG: hypothetical protein RRX93_00760 [Bacteroidales bacterium]
MKRFTFCAIMLLFSISISFALLPPQYTSDNFQLLPNQRAKRIVVKTFKAIDQGDKVKIGEPKENTIVASYNSNNDPTSFTELDKNGNVVVHYVVEYNINGLVTSEKKYSKLDLLELFSSFNYTNNKKENTLSEELIYNDHGNLVYVTTYARNKNGSPSSSQRLDGQRTVILSYIYTYDSLYRLESEILSDRNHKMQQQTRYHYNEDGRLELEEQQDSNGKLRGTTSYSYDEKGNKINIRISRTGEAVNAYRCDYLLDARGNWIKQTIYLNEFVPILVVTRQIEYM